MQKLVLDAILAQDGKTYRLDAVVVMPNHVHVLLGAAAGTLGKIVKQWKGPTARQINLASGSKGSVWYQEHYDRFIRDEEHFFTALRYLVDNPVKAGLVTSAKEWPGTWVCDELQKVVFQT
jgi:REP element-mobilizing transposase RayT